MTTLVMHGVFDMENAEKIVDLVQDQTGYGAYYFQPNEILTYQSKENEMYSYKAHIGKTEIKSKKDGGSHIFVSDDKERAIWQRNQDEVFTSNYLAIELPAYQCGTKTSTLDIKTNLPYVNGCSTRQIFPPERVGDPTLQYLSMPPHTIEQMHHIHPTARVVYVLSGFGYSIVGQSGKETETELKEGMTCILDPMCPHHFRTEDQYLNVLPMHIFSSTPPSLEQNHPMYNGTVEA